MTGDPPIQPRTPKGDSVMSTQTQSQSGGISFLGLLAIVFITLKLTDFIAWSWWWVLSPLWLSALIVLVVGLVVLVVLLVVRAFDR